jgi:hypothetical protein
MTKDTRQKRDLHAFDEHGMVLCNPRDKEAAHRAEMEGIATYDTIAVTCPKCVKLLHQQRRDRRGSTSSELPGKSLDADADDTVDDVGQPPESSLDPLPDVSQECLASHPTAVTGFRRVRGMQSLAADIRSGDGIDPREEKRQRLRTGTRRKSDLADVRLSSQIFDALCLSSLLAKIGLEDFTVTAVVPAERRGKFLINVSCVDIHATYEPEEIEAILEEKKGLFRSEVSQFVNRRKAPELQFRVLPPGFRP